MAFVETLLLTILYLLIFTLIFGGNINATLAWVRVSVSRKNSGNGENGLGCGVRTPSKNGKKYNI